MITGGKTIDCTMAQWLEYGPCMVVRWDRVEITDRMPAPGHRCWCWAADFTGATYSEGLPDVIRAHLDLNMQVSATCHAYGTEQAACDDLSRACLAWAREAAASLTPPAVWHYAAPDPAALADVRRLAAEQTDRCNLFVPMATGPAPSPDIDDELLAELTAITERAVLAERERCVRLTTGLYDRILATAPAHGAYRKVCEDIERAIREGHNQ